MSPSEKPASVTLLKSIKNRKFALRNVRWARMGLVFFCLGTIAVGSLAGATTSLENPYEVIYSRNVFRLRPPASATAAAPQPTVPLSTIILTGITTVLGNKRAFLEITPPPKPPQPAKPISCILTEGQREAGIEVLQIDPKTEFVKVLNNGTTMTLTFDKNGRKTTPPPQKAFPHLQSVRFPLRPPFQK